MGIKLWQKKPLKKLCFRIGDGLHGTPNYSDKTDIYFINGNNLKKGWIEITPNTLRVSGEDYESGYIELNDKTLLISINGTLGNMAFYHGEKIMLGKSAAYLNFSTRINIFYYYYFQLSHVQQYFYNVATGSTIKNLSLKSIQDFEVPVPNEYEWKKIAFALGTLDAKIELNHRINAELEQMAKTLYDYWFVQFDFPISAEQAAVMGKPELEGKPYKSSGGKMVYNAELKREIPEGWSTGSFDDLGGIVGGSTPSRNNPDFFNQSGIPWITPNDLSNNKGNKFISHGEFDITEAGQKNASLKLLPAGTILLTSRAPVGYLAIAKIDVTTNQGFKSFIPNKGYPSQFVYYAIKNSIKLIEKNASGSTFKEISAGVLKSLPTLLPSKSVIEDFDQKIQSTFKKQALLEEENQQLASLRDWLLPMLINGQVTVKEAKEEVRQAMAAEPEATYEKR